MSWLFGQALSRLTIPNKLKQQIADDLLKNKFADLKLICIFVILLLR